MDNNCVEVQALQSAPQAVIDALLRLYGDCVGSWLLEEGALESYITERIEGGVISPEWAVEQAIEDDSLGMPRGTLDATQFMRRCIDRLSDRVLWLAADGPDNNNAYLFGLYRTPAHACCVLMWEYANHQSGWLLARSQSDFALGRTIDSNGQTQQTDQLNEAGMAAITRWLNEYRLCDSGSQHKQTADEDREQNHEASESKAWFDAAVLEVVRCTELLFT